MSDFWHFLDQNFRVITIVALIIGTLNGVATYMFASRRLPALYRIAVVGFPRCGKTTLITALFAYLFHRGANNGRIRPTGEETINRINANLELLDRGLPISPTTDQDVFAYRAEITLDSPLPVPFSSRTYKVEIGDFPGEDSVDFAEKYGQWLHQAGYFKWAVGADAFIFVVDLSRLMSEDSEEYVARQKSALRAAWQRLQDQVVEGGRSATAKSPLVLVFTKADRWSEFKWMGTTGEPKPKPLTPANEINMNKMKESVQFEFADLISYFKRENQNFAVVFESVYLEFGGERLGIPEIAKAILPR